MTEFVNGLIVALDMVAALMFLKFWRGTRDRLFALFAISFLMMAASRIVLVMLPHFIEAHSEHTMPVYAVRLASYMVILLAIVDRNRRAHRVAAERRGRRATDSLRARGGEVVQGRCERGGGSR